MKKLVLKELNVQSFTTSESKKIDGGAFTDLYNCDTANPLCQTFEEYCTRFNCTAAYDCTMNCTYIC